MAPSEAPLNAEAIARAVTGLPAALFIGDVSGPLNAEAGALAEELDPKLEEIKVCVHEKWQALARLMSIVLQSNAYPAAQIMLLAVELMRS